MANWIYPPDGSDAPFIFYTGYPGLLDGKLLVPGPGITIVISGNNVTVSAPGGGGAPTAAKYVLNQADPSLPNAQDLSVLATGLTKVTTGTGLLSTAASGIDYGTVYDFSSGNLDPVFTTGVTNHDRAPNLTFTLENVASATIFAGPASGNAGPWQARKLVNTDLPIIAGTNVVLTQSGNNLVINSTASGGGSGGGIETFITVNPEPTLINSRSLAGTDPISVIDHGAGNPINIGISSSIDYETLGSLNSGAAFMFGADLGILVSSGAGTLALAASSQSVNPVDCTNGSFTFTLPLAATCLNKSFIFKKIDGTTNPITIQVSGLDFIDNQASAILTIPWQSYSIRAIKPGLWIIT